jgi:SpoVK/Ycf46/Vps4 family AAA+-type ATPase
MTHKAPMAPSEGHNEHSLIVPKEPSEARCPAGIVLAQKRKQSDEKEKSFEDNKTEMTSVTTNTPILFGKIILNKAPDKVDLDDLIELGKNYNPLDRTIYNVDLKKVNAMIPELESLKNVIGMEQVKKELVKHISYYVQNMHCYTKEGFIPNYIPVNMMHIVLCGPPGVGKTLLGSILGKIYLKLGFLRNNVFRIAKRSDLVARFLGQTADQTLNFIKSCYGGVMFIDEAYALGNEGAGDSYSMECINVINQSLENMTQDTAFLCIVAGYEDQLDRCFFSRNPGLKSRFPYWYRIESYTIQQLKQIFVKKINDSGWYIDSTPKNKKRKTDEAIVKRNDPINDFFIDHKQNFPYFGRDMELLATSCKMTHGLRTLCSEDFIQPNILTIEDVENGFSEFDKFRKKEIPSTLYI